MRGCQHDPAGGVPALRNRRSAPLEVRPEWWDHPRVGSKSVRVLATGSFVVSAVLSAGAAVFLVLIGLVVLLGVFPGWLAGRMTA